MRRGLFGKLQAKRDFIAFATPRQFLSVWEPWLQAGMSASRMQLDQGWQNAFLTSPIWRFWLGADVCGTTAIGAIMPSMDGIGRYFPLTFVAFADEGSFIPPPEINQQDDWFASVEDFLFSTLEQGRAFEQITADVEALPAPASEGGEEARTRTILMPQGAAVAAAPGGAFADAFTTVRAADHGRAYAASTFWWTAGGEGYEPMVFQALRMPDPYLFTPMLTGRFAPPSIPTVPP